MSDKYPYAADSGTGPLGEISQAPPALEAFLDRHQSKLIALAVVLALGAVGYVIYDGIEESRQVTAGALLSKATEISDFQDVVEKHAGSKAAYSASILLAEKQWSDGQQDDAIKTLRNFLDSKTDHPAKPSATSSLATKLLSQGKVDDALDLFQSITENPDSHHLAAYAWIALGDIWASRGDSDRASTAYEAVEHEFPGSPFTQQAMERRLLLKAKNPDEVMAPITVPETRFGEDEEPQAPSSDDLIEALKGGAGGSNPLVPAE